MPSCPPVGVGVDAAVVLADVAAAVPVELSPPPPQAASTRPETSSSATMATTERVLAEGEDVFPSDMDHNPCSCSIWRTLAMSGSASEMGKQFSCSTILPLRGVTVRSVLFGMCSGALP